MTTTTTTHETVSAESRTNTILKFPGSHYTYLGEDTEGGHHHLNEETDTIYVTDQPPERYLPTNAAIYWFRVHGTLEHVESLSSRPVHEWVAYVDHVRGWTTQPLLIDATFLQGGLDR
ncbi:hypothetical protein ACLI4Q_06310 [Natrialbaceae archaeon A-CW1-1]